MKLNDLFLIMIMFFYFQVSVTTMKLSQNKKVQVIQYKKSDYFNIYESCSKDKCDGPNAYCVNQNHCK